MIVAKAVKMAQMMNIPVIGLVENMSYFECPDCDKKNTIYLVKAGLKKWRKSMASMLWQKCPLILRWLVPAIKGLIELFENNWLDQLVEILEKMQNPEDVFSPEFLSHDAMSQEGYRS